MSVLTSNMYVQHMHAAPKGDKECARFPGVTDGQEPPYRCWKVTPGPLQEQKMILPNEPSFQPLFK